MSGNKILSTVTRLEREAVLLAAEHRMLRRKNRRLRERLALSEAKNAELLETFRSTNHGD